MYAKFYKSEDSLVYLNIEYLTRMPSFSNFKTVNRIKFKIYNEKSLFFLLLVLSVITVFIVLMNLPTDIQTKKDIQNVFIPKVESQVNKHEENHQHEAPPIYQDKKAKPAEDDSKIIQTSKSLQEPKAADNNLKLGDIDSLTTAKRRDKIKEMTLFGWTNYERYAWGENELKPISKTGHSAGIFGSNPTKLGATIVDGLDTMFLMGYMDEYRRGRDWIANSFNINVVSFLKILAVILFYFTFMLSILIFDLYFNSLLNLK